MEILKKKNFENGNMEKWKFGKMKIWKNRNFEKGYWENGNLEKWKFGKMES